MADPFVAEIRRFAGNFAPKGWAFCNGQLMPISQNTALFSLLGTTYGGDGKSTFALPDLQGSAPMHPGDGPGLSQRFLGEQSGSQTVSLLQTEMPAHNHNMMAVNDVGDSNAPAGLSMARSQGASVYNAANSPVAAMAFTSLAPAGGSLPHNNMQPYLTLNFIMALQGVFPQRP